MKCLTKDSTSLAVVMLFVAAFITFDAAEAPADPFGNLDFESAAIASPGAVGSRPVSGALPCWTTNLGDYVAYDATALDSAYISLHDGLNYVGVWNDPNPLQGSYSISLQDGFFIEHSNIPTSVWISQTGDIPTYAKSLKFQSDTSTYINDLQVSINGVAVPFTLYSPGTTVVNPSWGPVKTYICDISSFTGEPDATLEFEKLVHDPTNPFMHSIVDLDAITFSRTVVPEPSMLVLLAVAALAASAHLFRRRRAVAVGLGL